MKGLWKEICQDWADFWNNWKVMGASEGVPIEERMNAFFGQITFFMRYGVPILWILGFIYIVFFRDLNAHS